MRNYPRYAPLFKYVLRGIPFLTDGAAWPLSSPRSRTVTSPAHRVTCFYPSPGPEACEGPFSITPCQVDTDFPLTFRGVQVRNPREGGCLPPRPVDPFVGTARDRRRAPEWVCHDRATLLQPRLEDSSPAPALQEQAPSGLRLVHGTPRREERGGRRQL